MGVFLYKEPNVYNNDNLQTIPDRHRLTHMANKTNKALSSDIAILKSALEKACTMMANTKAFSISNISSKTLNGITTSWKESSRRPTEKELFNIFMSLAKKEKISV